ncbi:hypothetical protein GF352_03275 [archaeon]|nr:hypothetical protein [archaeon]
MSPHDDCTENKYIKTSDGYICPACGHVYCKLKEDIEFEIVIKKPDSNLVPIDCLSDLIKQKKNSDEVPMYKFFEEYDFEEDDSTKPL